MNWKEIGVAVSAVFTMLDSPDKMGAAVRAAVEVTVVGALVTWLGGWGAVLAFLAMYHINRRTVDNDKITARARALDDCTVAMHAGVKRGDDLLARRIIDSPYGMELQDLTAPPPPGRRL